MRIHKAIGFGAAILAGVGAAAAQAEPLTGPQIQARSAGGEFRGYGSTRRSHLEDMIWRLAAGGAVTSISSVRRGARDTGTFLEYRDAGSWRVDGNRLCVQFQTVHADLSGCYSVDGAGGSQVRLAGPVQLQGTFGQ